MPQTWTDPFVRPKHWKSAVRFGTWTVISLCRSGSLTAATRELARYRLYLVGTQEVRWGKEGLVKPGDYILFYGKGHENHQMGTAVFVHDGIVSVVKSVELVSDTVSIKRLRSLWCNITVLNVHVANEEKSEDSKDSFYGELEQVSDHFHKYHMKIVL